MLIVEHNRNRAAIIPEVSVTNGLPPSAVLN